MVLIRNALAPESFDTYVQEVKLAKGHIYPHMRMRFSMFAKKYRYENESKNVKNMVCKQD